MLLGIREGNAEKSWQWETPTITHFSLSTPANFRISRNAGHASYTQRNTNKVRSRPPLTSANGETMLHPICTVTLSCTRRATVTSISNVRTLLHDSTRGSGAWKTSLPLQASQNSELDAGLVCGEVWQRIKGEPCHCPFRSHGRVYVWTLASNSAFEVTSLKRPWATSTSFQPPVLAPAALHSLYRCIEIGCSARTKKSKKSDNY